jgi:hypothetical protein
MRRVFSISVTMSMSGAATGLILNTTHLRPSAIPPARSPVRVVYRAAVRGVTW